MRCRIIDPHRWRVIGLQEVASSPPRPPTPSFLSCPSHPLLRLFSFFFSHVSKTKPGAKAHLHLPSASVSWLAKKHPSKGCGWDGSRSLPYLRLLKATFVCCSRLAGICQYTARIHYICIYCISLYSASSVCVYSYECAYIEAVVVH